MGTEKRYWGKSIAAFTAVLFTMPLGHALMILMEHYIDPSFLHTVTFLVGVAGLAIVVAGVFVKSDLKQTKMGFSGGLLFRSEEDTSELQSPLLISHAVFCV